MRYKDARIGQRVRYAGCDQFGKCTGTIARLIRLGGFIEIKVDELPYPWPYADDNVWFAPLAGAVEPLDLDDVKVVKKRPIITDLDLEEVEVTLICDDCQATRIETLTREEVAGAPYHFTDEGDCIVPGPCPACVLTINYPFPDRIHLRFDKDHLPEIYWEPGDDTKEYIRLDAVRAAGAPVLAALEGVGFNRKKVAGQKLAFRKTAHQQRLSELMSFIVGYKYRHDGCSPTLREVVDNTSYTSTSVVAYALNKLEQQGRIKYTSENGESRRIMVVGGKWTYSPPANGDPT